MWTRASTICWNRRHASLSDNPSAILCAGNLVTTEQIILSHRPLSKSDAPQIPAKRNLAYKRRLQRVMSNDHHLDIQSSRDCGWWRRRTRVCRAEDVCERIITIGGVITILLYSGGTRSREMDAGKRVPAFRSYIIPVDAKRVSGSFSLRLRVRNRSHPISGCRFAIRLG